MRQEHVAFRSICNPTRPADIAHISNPACSPTLRESTHRRTEKMKTTS
ncbi:protein of unknown function [Streptomyces sp. KY75]|nr:protein of unknown function [Streptomyces sp. KY70]CAD5987534.1 protein of unknown function [Streptomyces sp. KY75]